jgi:hypothetical protein
MHRRTPPTPHAPAPRRPLRVPAVLLTALLALALLGPAAALASGGGGGGGGGGGDDNGGGGHGGGARPEVRVAGACGRGATSKLKLKARDGAIEAEFEVHGRAHQTWRVVFVQESRIVWRGHARTASLSSSFSVERRISDYAGPDQVTARAVGPRGLTCQASATLPG